MDEVTGTNTAQPVGKRKSKTVGQASQTEICGQTVDHKIEVIDDDGDFIQWRCAECGAEGEGEAT